MLNFGMPPGFAEALAMKYGIMKQQADAQTDSLGAAASLDRAKASVVPTESAANVGEAQARTAGIGLTNRTILPLAQSAINLQGAQTEDTNQEALSRKQLNRPLTFGLGGGGIGDTGYGFGGQGFSFSRGL